MPYCNRDLKRDDHFDNHPDRHPEVLWVQVLTHPRTFEPKEFKGLGARVYGFRGLGFIGSRVAGFGV